MSCNPLKKSQSTQTEHNSSFDAVVNTQQQEHQEAEAVTVTVKQTDEGYRKTTEVFDTTRPVDPETGTPPLQERVTEQYGRTQSERQGKAEKTTTETDLNISEELKLDEQTEETIEITQERGLTTVQRIHIYIGIFTVIAVLVWLALKIKNRLKLL